MENEGINYSDYVYYDESSPTCLRWKVDRNQAVEINSKAGGFERDREGKIVNSKVRIENKHHNINRVIWSLFHGRISRNVFVIYIDGDKSNNRISNLRLKVKEDYPPADQDRLILTKEYLVCTAVSKKDVVRRGEYNRLVMLVLICTPNG